MEEMGLADAYGEKSKKQPEDTIQSQMYSNELDLFSRALC